MVVMVPIVVPKPWMHYIYELNACCLWKWVQGLGKDIGMNMTFNH